MRIETKYDIGDKIYGLIRKPKKPEDVFVVCGTVHKISIFEKCIMYNMTDIKVELNKTGKEKSAMPYGFFYENELDPIEIQKDKKVVWFSSKKNCQEYIKKCLER